MRYVVHDLYFDWLKEYKARTKRSLKLYNRARMVMPLGVSYNIRFFDPYPFYVVRARNSQIEDVNGNTYDDYWMGHGSLFLGHAHRDVADAVKAQVEAGSHFGLAHEREVELAELVTKCVPNAEMVRFTNSGTEAIMYAIRLARAYTGRDKIVKVEGGWHGGYDCLHVSVSPPFDGPESAGIAPKTTSDTKVMRFNDPGSVTEHIRGKDVAAVVLEPVMGAGGGIPANSDYLKSVREQCDAQGSLLIFDEVITGFRLALGGAQEHYGVGADIVVLGKILGGGYPIGAFASSTELMHLLDHTKFPMKSQRSYHGGTFSSNPISMVAGVATINYLRKNSQTIYPKANELGRTFRQQVRGASIETNRPIHTTGIGSIVGLHFTRGVPRSAREAYETRWCDDIYSLFHLYARLNGIFFQTERMPHLMLSVKHTRTMVERFVRVLNAFMTRTGKSNALQTKT